MKSVLIDQHNRKHNYLRISLLERCNLRCKYCMPEDGIPLRDKSEFMSQEELFEIIDQFVGLGIDKIRLTGGEPLLKKNFPEILKYISERPVSIHLTTNGILLDRYWNELEKAKISGLNISIDSLNKDRFNQITRRDYFDRVMTNIHEAVNRGFNVKLNVVLIRGFNDDEIIDFVRLTKSLNIAIRFIEFMPFDGNNWDRSQTIDYREILKKIDDENLEYASLGIEKNGTSRNFNVKGHAGIFGIISSISNPFCDSCNRIRLTADGKIKNCLFSNSEVDLLSALRNKEDLTPLIESAIHSKKISRAGLKSFDDKNFEFKNRSMTSIGG